MKRLLLFLIPSFMATVAFSQTDYTISQSNFSIGETAIDFINSNERGALKNRLSLEDIQGSPYLNDEFTNGTVYTTSKIQYNNVKLRYNIYNDQIEFESNGKILAMSQPETMEKIVFDGNTILYVPYTNSKKITRGYLILLQGGKASLFYRPEVIFKNAEVAGAYKDAEPPRFIEGPDSYYIRIGTDDANLISNKNDLIDVFPDNKDKIEAFIKKHKVKPGKVESLKELVNYYNSL